MKYVGIGLILALLYFPGRSSVEMNSCENPLPEDRPWAIFLANGFSKNRISLWIGEDRILENIVAETTSPWSLTGIMVFIDSDKSVCDVYIVEDFFDKIGTDVGGPQYSVPLSRVPGDHLEITISVDGKAFKKRLSSKLGKELMIDFSGEIVIQQFIKFPGFE